MLDLTQTYEVVIFSIGDTKAGTKMGKLQLKNLADDSVLNCILWEEALNRIDGKVFRTGNQVKILGGSYNEKYNNLSLSRRLHGSTASSPSPGEAYMRDM